MSATTSLTPGSHVAILERNRTVGGGELLAVEGNVITIAQTIEHYIGADGAEDTLERVEIVIDTYTLGRYVTAVVR